MDRHFHEELRVLKQKFLRMGFLVESAIEKAVESLLQHKLDLARKVFEEERQINQLEIEIDDKAHELLALGQPMAVDLRIITAALKMNTDLERMGDHAVNIAERAIMLTQGKPVGENFQLLRDMAQAAQKTVSDALNSFIYEDATLARNVLKRDDVIDAYNSTLHYEVQTLMEAHPKEVKAGLIWIEVAHNLERIGDLANNIAEDVVYILEGKEVRHNTEKTT